MKLGRNEPCWCDSGKKFKKCHLNRDAQKPVNKSDIFKQINSFYPRIVLNIGRNKQAISLGSRLRQICKKNIGINMEYIGFIEYTELVSASIINRTALVLSSPNSQFARAIRKIAENLVQVVYIDKPVLYDSDEDINNLGNFV